MSITSTTLRGRALAPDPDTRAWTLLPDALLQVGPDGCFSAVGPAPEGCAVPESWPGAVLVPGFVDAHLHFPQTRIIGSASGPLLPWLDASVFPEEARFSDPAYAAGVAEVFCRAMLAQGTTLAGIYSSSHPRAADALFEALDRHGLRAITGVTWMDQGAPKELLVPALRAHAATEALVARWHGHDDDRLRVAVTPRFALSCSSRMMGSAGALARARGLWVQTHLSENPDELLATAETHPGHPDYLGVYEHHDLVGARTILAHCIHLSDSEWERLVQAGAVVAHCPDSNFFLGSGCMPLAAALERGARVALGTDVGAGRTFSLRRVVASAYDASLVLGRPVPPPELLWLATRGGAVALGLGESLGCLAPCFDADVVALDAPADLPLERLVDALVFRHDAGPARATLIRGQLRHGEAPA